MQEDLLRSCPRTDRRCWSMGNTARHILTWLSSKQRTDRIHRWQSHARSSRPACGIWLTRNLLANGFHGLLLRVQPAEEHKRTITMEPPQVFRIHRLNHALRIIRKLHPSNHNESREEPLEVLRQNRTWGPPRLRTRIRRQMEEGLCCVPAFSVC